MARAKLKTKNRGGKAGEYRCAKCADPIKPGEKYYQWAFRYGGTFRQHATHGAPRASQLTQSKLSEVFAAQEALDDFLGTSVASVEEPEAQLEDARNALDQTKGDADSVIQEALDACENVIGEYEDAIDAMPASEEQNRERIDALEEWQSALESAQTDVEGVEPEDEDDADSIQGAIDEIVEKLHEVAGELSA